MMFLCHPTVKRKTARISVEAGAEFQLSMSQNFYDMSNLLHLLLITRNTAKDVFQWSKHNRDTENRQWHVALHHFQCTITTTTNANQSGAPTRCLASINNHWIRIRRGALKAEAQPYHPSLQVLTTITNTITNSNWNHFRTANSLPRREVFNPHPLLLSSNVTDQDFFKKNSITTIINNSNSVKTITKSHHQVTRHEYHTRTT